MADSKLHISKAERNKEFCDAQKLCGSKYQEWGVVVLFYAALHYVDAVLATDPSLPRKQRHPFDHRTRKKAVSNCSSLNPIAGKYLDLLERSEDVRYKCIINFPKGYATTLETNYFKPIEGYLRHHLGLT